MKVGKRRGSERWNCWQRIEKEIGEGHYHLVFLSPEALLTDSQWHDMLLSATYHERLVGLVIDEAH